MHRDTQFEWQTICLLLITYSVWGFSVIWLAEGALGLSVVLVAVGIAFHASLQHEAIHGHPFRWAFLNTLIAWPPLTLCIPFLRYRDTHLAHHGNCDLTDPFEDPETNYLAADDWAKMNRVGKLLFHANNTLAGRLLLGPLIGTFCFLRSDLNQMSDPKVQRGWAWHLPTSGAVLAVVILSPMPLWAYLIAAYLALALLRIRTFLEHQAHAFVRARSVIIEDKGPLAFLFLNNNLHAVHHAHPDVPWYRLPQLYNRHKARFLEMNQGYAYRSYAEVFRRYLFRSKDPVVHPLRQPNG